MEEPKIPGEEQPKPDTLTLRQELTFACREALRQASQSRDKRREIFLEAWNIMRVGAPIHDRFQVLCAELILRAAVESGIDHRHLSEGLTTALGILKTPDQPEGGKILVTS